MADSTIKKVEAASSPRGEMGQKYLVGGKRVSMRLWVLEPGSKVEAATSREYETVGYVISGRAKLDLEGQTLSLKPGDSWLVPAGASHHYEILEPFTAIEATAPPAEVHGRDTPASTTPTVDPRARHLLPRIDKSGQASNAAGPHRSRPKLQR